MAGRLELALQSPARAPGLSLPELRRWLRRLVHALVPEARSLTVRLTFDREVRGLNLRHRGRDATTDVLSYPGGRGAEGYHLGDIVVSLPQARRQADAAGHALVRELRALCLHGVLHCLGYDHERDSGEMQRMERRLRRRWLDEP